MTADITYHYPPELMNLLVDTIPLLNRSKKDVLIFFRGAGVAQSLTDDLQRQLGVNPTATNKFEIVRTLLGRLNAKGETTLGERREVLKRVVEFSNFDSCWPADQLKAKGLVAAIREVVNQRDAFTRMNQARDEERQARIAEQAHKNAVVRQRQANIEAAKMQFYGLFAANLTPSARGKALESALNDVFKAYDILIREAFHLVGEASEGIVEQIDGVIELKGVLHFVEMKWYQAPVGKAEISEHLVRLMSRAEARGIFVSASDYTEPAIHTCREFLSHKLVAVATLQELVRTLEQQADLADFLTKKIHAAQIYKNPYLRLM